MSPPPAGAAWTAQDSVPSPSPAAKAAILNNRAFDTVGGCLACVKIDANAHIAMWASIGSVSPNLAPPQPPAELIIVKLCEEAFPAFCARRLSGLGEAPSVDLCKV